MEIPRIFARRVKVAPVIDGRLDDAGWGKTSLHKGFVQRNPNEGAAPDQRTEFRIMHDSGAVYVGLRMWDDAPGKIRQGLGQRDAAPDSDNIFFAIDPLMTGKKGYFFQVNASGVLADGIIYHETTMDGSWDGVWSAAVQVDGRGWTAELKIPLHSIAYQDRTHQRWGFYLERYVQRLKQTSSWPPMPRQSNTFVSRFALLEGLTDLKRETSLRLLPYVASSFQIARRSGSLAPDRLLRPNGGLDLHYGIGGEMMIHASINPDFGQVEDDAAVVNLGPNEVFFGEKRPFFVAGANVFRTPLTLLHTRRIGATPFPPTEEEQGNIIVEVDPETRIIGAAKLVGEAGPASYGLLTALVLPTYAVEERPGGGQFQRLASRGANFAAARLKFRIGAASTLGFMGTGVTRLDEIEDTDAYAGGIDWDIRSAGGWQTTGQVIGATALEGSGYGLKVSAGQQGGPRWRYWVDMESYSDRFQINDVGYQWRNDMVLVNGTLAHMLTSPWGELRDLQTSLTARYGFNHTTPEISFDRRMEINTYGKFNNLWGVWAGAGYRFFTLDDRETRGGHAYPRPEEIYGWIGGESNTSRRVVANLTASLSWEGGAMAMSLQTAIQTSLFNRLTLSLEGRYQMDRSRMRWVETLDVEPWPRYIFGALTRDELELKLRGVIAFHRLVTLSVFAQMLHSAGTYESYHELFVLDDGQTTLGPTSHDSMADFSSLQFIVNAILRWDLGSGTAAYLVYKLDGLHDPYAVPTSAPLGPAGPAAPPTEPPPAAAFDLGGSLSGLASRRQNHTLLLKISYGWNI